MMLLKTPVLKETFFAQAHNAQWLSHLSASPYEVVFHTQLRIPLNVQLNLSLNNFRECIAQNCSDLRSHSHYESTDSNSLFRRIMLKPVSIWFLAIETAMLQINSKVYQNALKRNLLHIQCKTNQT